MDETVGEKIAKERSEICGELWPHSTKTLSSLEVFERLLSCIRNRHEAGIHYARYNTSKDQDLREEAAWRNAARIYEDVLRIRLGGEGEGMADEQPR